MAAVQAASAPLQIKNIIEKVLTDQTFENSHGESSKSSGTRYGMCKIGLMPRQSRAEANIFGNNLPTSWKG